MREGQKGSQKWKHEVEHITAVDILKLHHDVVQTFQIGFSCNLDLSSPKCGSRLVKFRAI